MAARSCCELCCHQSPPTSAAPRGPKRGPTMNELHNRRAFLRAAAAAGAAWAAADLVQVEDALAWAGQQAAHGAGAPSTAARALTQAQADVIEAMVSRIIPSVDGRPGAREAGAVHFVDRALATFNAS